MGNQIEACCCGAGDKAENKDDKEMSRPNDLPPTGIIKPDLPINKRTTYIELDPTKPNLGFKSKITARELFGMSSPRDGRKSKIGRKKKRQPENDHPKEDKIEVFARV